MKLLSLFTVLIFAATSSAYAAPIIIGGVDLAATANNVTTSSGAFYNYETPRPPYATGPLPAPISAGQLNSDLSDNNAATYIFSPTLGAFVDLGFSGGIYNGAGNDLALFFVGDTGAPSIEINGITRNYAQQYLPQPTTANDGYRTYNLTMAMINLDDFGLTYNANVSSIKVNFNDMYTALSMAGSIYNTAQPSAVPLPLPALLFASGLGALGLFGRRRKQQD